MAKPAKKKDEMVVRAVREKLRQAQDAEADNREDAIEDIKFENGEQWEETTYREREAAGRPCLTINKVAATVKQIVGDMRQTKFSIKVRPVDDQADPGTAETLSGIIRNIENMSHAEDAYDYAGECAVRGGWGYFRILTDYASDDVFDQDIFIKRVVNPFSVYFDPACVEPDKSDARWCIVTETIEKEQFESDYPGKSTTNSLELDSGEDDSSWFAEETVTVAEYWGVEHKPSRILLLADGRVVKAEEIGPEAVQMLTEAGAIVRERTAMCPYVKWWKVSGCEVLEGPKDWAGRWIPIIPVLGEEVWIEGKPRYRSAIRWAKDPNRLYNWARSNAVETLALAPRQPFIGTAEMFDGNEDQWDNAHRIASNRLVAKFDNGMLPQRQPASLSDSGAIQEAMMAADDIKATTGLYDASLGAKGNETSGKAIVARQSEGDTATFVFTDNLKRGLAHAGRVLVDLIPKIYDTERVVRLLGQDGAENWAKINQETPMGRLNDLSIGKYDVVVDTGPAYKTKRMEAADGMVSIVTAAPQFAPVLVPEVVKNLDWPGADKIAEQMAALVSPPQPQGPSPKDQMELAKGQQEVFGKQLDNQKKQQDMALQGMEGDQRTYSIAMQAVMDAFQRMMGR